MSTDQIFLWSVFILAALAGDLWLHRRLHQAWRARGVHVLMHPAERAVGALSALLDRGRDRLAAAGRQLQEETGRRLEQLDGSLAAPALAARSPDIVPPPHPRQPPFASSPPTDDSPVPITPIGEPPSTETPPSASAPGAVPAGPPAPARSPTASLSPPRSPRVAQVQVTLTVPPGAHLRLRIDDVSPGLPEPLPLMAQDLYAPAGQEEVPATVAVTFGPLGPPQAVLPPASPAPDLSAVPAPAAAIAAPVPAASPSPASPAPGMPVVTAPAIAAPLPPAASPSPASPAPGMPVVTAPATAAPVPAAASAARPVPAWLARSRAALAGPAARARSIWRADRLALAFFGGALLVYAVTRLVGLERFPIYFFTDEAVQTLQAADFVDNGWRDFQDRFFPTYFQNGVYYNLSVSVYAQVLPYLLWGKSIFLTRAVPALLSLAGVTAVSLALRQVFQARWWWLGVLLLAVTPAWFLHSRTAFETVLMVSFYAWFLYLYLLYRVRHPKFLLPALVFGALAFYSYAGGQMVVVLTGALLGLSDLRYHWTHRRWALRGVALLVLLMLPYLRFQLDQPGESLAHLRTLNAYWFDRELTLPDKLAQLAREYALGLSPGFWFAANNNRDLVRHVLNGYGHLLPATAPFLLVGLAVCVRRIREAPYRALLLALLAAPAGGALTAIGITRVLVLVIPAALLTAIGLEFVCERVLARWGRPVGVGLFVLLAGFNGYMLRDALVNGPVWSDDYGLGGMQWGVPQLFGEVVPDLLAADPDLRIYLSPTWANGADLFPRFFLDETQSARLQLQGPDYYLSELRDLPPNHLVILLASEHERLAADPKIGQLDVLDQLPFPNGAPGYLFTRLRYSPEAAALFAAEYAANQVPVTEQFELNGQMVTITHPRFGAGRLNDLLDGDPFTLISAPEINPIVFDFVFPAPRTVSGLTLITGSLSDFTVTLEAFADPNGESATVSQTFRDLEPDPTVSLALDGALPAARVRVTVQDNRAGPGVNIHVRELTLVP